MSLKIVSEMFEAPFTTEHFSKLIAESPDCCLSHSKGLPKPAAQLASVKKWDRQQQKRDKHEIQQTEINKVIWRLIVFFCIFCLFDWNQLVGPRMLYFVVCYWFFLANSGDDNFKWRMVTSRAADGANT